MPSTRSKLSDAPEFISKLKPDTSIVSSIQSITAEFYQLGSISWEEVKNIFIFPGVHLDAEPIIVPKDYVPQGELRRESTRTIYVAQFVTLPCTTTHSTRQVAEQSLRRTLLALRLPKATERGVRVIKPSTWMTHAKRTLRLASAAMEIKPSKDGMIWRDLTRTDFENCIRRISRKEKVRRSYRAIVDWLYVCGITGILQDAPKILTADIPTDGPDFDRSLDEDDAPTKRVLTEETHYLPFPDAFVSEFIWRAIWIIENIAEPVIDCWIQLIEEKKRAEAAGQSSKWPATVAKRRQMIASTVWLDKSGKPITRLPFKILQKVNGATTEMSDAWPPRNASTINMMISTIQALNFALVSFCAGCRISETCDGSSDSLAIIDGEASYIARTFKLVANIRGQLRSWPIHPVAASALRIQDKLASVIRPAEKRHLWVCFVEKNSGAPVGSQLTNLNEPFVKVVKFFDLKSILEGTRPHEHRWRMTIARLAALTVTGAPQVLFDLFGHRDPAMTVGYMVAHPQILSDTLKVADEMAQVMAKTAVTEIVASQAEGAAARRIKASVENLRMKRGEEFYGAESLRELSEILTFNGRHWEYVREGVICTKGLGAFGPCARSRGEPDPAACRTDCDHRLELQAAKSDCNRLIGQLIEELKTAEADGLLMVAANLRGQLKANLQRWPDVTASWAEREPIVQEILDAKEDRNGAQKS